MTAGIPTRQPPCISAAQPIAAAPTLSAPAPSAVEILPVTSRPADLRRFWCVMLGASGREPRAVIPLADAVVEVLSDANPFFTRARRALWIARVGGRDVGRLATFIDPEWQAGHGPDTGFFGFYEDAGHPGVTPALFAAADAWGRAHGIRRWLGPLNPNLNEEAGLLVDGFDQPNAILMPHNPPDYAERLTAVGCRGVKDLLAFEIEVARSPAGRLERISAGLQRRVPEIRFRPVSRRSLASDLPLIKEVYNAAWERNWGASPMTGPEIDFLAARLRPLLVEGLVWLATGPGGPAGLLLALPDLNEVLGPMRGRLFCPAALKALPYLAGWRRPRGFRLVALGVTPGYRGRGVEAVLFARTLQTALTLGFRHCEASWVLEDNVAVHRLVDQFEGRRSKTYRLYERDVPTG